MDFFLFRLLLILALLVALVVFGVIMSPYRRVRVERSLRQAATALKGRLYPADAQHYAKIEWT
jgi:uncharacterized protein (DUF58 family)